jgi:hypothetical protein
MFWLVGYNLAYGIPEGGFIGTFTPWSDASALDTGADYKPGKFKHLDDAISKAKKKF